MAKSPRRGAVRHISPKPSPAALNAAQRAYQDALARHDYPQALQAVQQALRFAPGNASLLSSLAFCQLRCNDPKAARKNYLKIAALPEAAQEQAGETWLDGLAEACGLSGHPDEVSRFGNLSLTRADAQYGSGHSWRLPETAPPAFDPGKPEQNIIAFTLFGASPKYCETAVMNALAAPRLYPGWTCRFWVDNSVPSHVVNRLRRAGAQIVDMTDSGSTLSPLMWRFMVIDDPDVVRFIIRDCDSLISERENAAVNAWLASDRWFHMMRDYFSHTELILAGMWGGCGGVLPPLAQMMAHFVANYQGNTHFIDQRFLRVELWPTVRQSLLTHDDIFGFWDAQPFPAHPPVRWNVPTFHVGSNVGFAEMAANAPAGRSEVEVVFTGQDGVAFGYPCRVHSGQWRLALPWFMADAYQNKQLTISVV